MAKLKYDKMEHISDVPLFARLNQKQLRRVARHVDEVTVPAGRVLSREERPGGKELLIVVEGELEIKRRGKVLAAVGPGGVVGEMSLIDKQPYSATVTATEESTLLVISPRSFQQLLNEVPEVKDKILLVLVERLRAADESLTG